MDFQLEKGILEQMHTQKETEVTFIVRGEAKAWTSGKCYELGANAVILFNSGTLHRLCCQENTVVGRALFLDCEIASMVKNENLLFYCNSIEAPNYACQRLTDIFRALIDYEVLKKQRSECMKYSLLYQMLDCLIENFSKAAGPGELPKMSDDERMQLILRYVERNFGENIQLSDLAERLFVSTSTVSRFFKKQTGSYFKEYLKKVRLRYALERLENTDESMTKIAMDCGFANPSVFNHIFRDVYGMAPNVYRKQSRSQGKKAFEERQACREVLLSELAADRIKTYGNRKTSLQLSLDMPDKGVFKKICNEAMNLGAIDHLTRVNLQKHTLYLKEKLGIRYVRLWNIFSKKLELTDGVHTGSYNYDMLDSALDFLVANDLVPFLEFGKRVAVAMECTNKTVYKEEEYIEFQSREAWEAMFKDFLHHVTARYGKEEVSQWRFELAKNRLGGVECQCYIDKSYDYFNVYDYVWRTVKSVLPGAMVGGPMGFGKFDLPFFEQFLIHCRAFKCMPDFVSWALFPYEINSSGEMARHLIHSPGSFECEVVHELKKLMSNVIGQSCPLFVTEWNFSISSRNYLNDSCYRAVYLAKVAAALAGQVDMLCVWVASDWISSYYDTVSIANGGNGILTKNTIPKPVCLAMEFFNRMGGCWLAGGSNYIFTKTESNEFYILCFYFPDDGSRLLWEGENVEAPEKIVKDFDDEKVQTIELALSGLDPETTYMLKWRRLNEREGSILGAWEAFGYESRLLAEDISYIKESCRPKLAIERHSPKDGQLCLTVDLQEQELVFIHGFGADFGKQQKE